MGAGVIEPRGLYLHLAFCPYLCPYCDFAKERWDAARAGRYLSALRNELERAEPFRATTLFLGGGTPNTYPPASLAELVAIARRRFELPAGAEISIECNPDPGLCEGFALYREAGISRISFGVQSFVPEELKVLGRRHRAEDVEAAVRRARVAGFVDISIDLIFGVPGQSLATLDRSIDAALALDLPHLSAYGLTIEEGTPFERWRAREPGLFGDEAWEAELYGRLMTRLQAAGYEQYELSNFARPGRRCRHNAQYWNNDEYAGFGLGAASYRNGVRDVHTKEFDRYVEAVERGREIPGESEELEHDARVGEAIMLALRRSEGVDGGAFAARYHVDPVARYSAVIARYSDAGLLETDTAGFRLTAAGKFLANEVCAAFLKTVP